MNDFEFGKGYEAYKRGEKVPRWPTQAFLDGWWSAYDHEEKFGQYDSFMQSPG